jgi:4-oxalocrotonate tautomerase
MFMPILNVKISGEPNPETTKSVSALLVKLTARILRKKPDVTAVAIDYVPEGQWFVGAETLDQQGKGSFYFDIKVTEGTNTKDEMARYIEAAFAGLKEILGEVHPESYICVQEVRAFSWGYGGRTQENRYIASKLQTEAVTR